jgi:hypothetical protein
VSFLVIRPLRRGGRLAYCVLTVGGVCRLFASLGSQCVKASTESRPACPRQPVLNSTRLDAHVPSRPAQGLSCREGDARRSVARPVLLSLLLPSIGGEGIRDVTALDRVPHPHRCARARVSRPWRPALVLEATGLRHGLCCHACAAARDPGEVGSAAPTERRTRADRSRSVEPSSLGSGRAASLN